MLPNPIIPPLEIGPLSLYPFGILVGIGIVVGADLARRRAAAQGLKVKAIRDAAMWAVIPGFIGAHLYSVLLYYPYKVAENPLVLFKIWSDISSVGGFIGATLGAIYFFRKRKLSFWPYADCLVYGFAVGWLFGRLGCTVAFDHPGDLTHFVLGMTYPEGRSLPAGVRHNLGFYEVFWAAGVSLFFYTQRRRARFAGWYVTVFGLAYFPFRFFLDFMRAEDERYLGLTPAQLACIPLWGLCIWLFFNRRAAAQADHAKTGKAKERVG